MTLLSIGALTVVGYQARTGDVASGSADVEQALEDAEARIVEELRRTVDGASALASDTYSARLRIHPDGRVYPPAYPVTACDDLTIESSWVLLGATPEGGPFVTYSQRSPARATVTWTGGYTALTLPASLANAIYDLGHSIAVPAATPIPAGVSSLSLGDVSVSYSTEGAPSGDLDSQVPGLSERICRYQNRLGDGLA